MEQEKAVQMMIRSIKQAREIPEEYLGFVRHRLTLMFVMGFDERGKSIGKNISKKRRKSVCQLNKEGKLIDTFPTVKIAAKKVGHCSATIYSLVKSKQISSKGHYWIMEKELLLQKPT